METKLYNLKIESLQADNRLLQAQVADYAKVVAELEAAKAKIKLLRKKLRSDAEQNREHILSLQERVMKLRDPETKAVEVDQDVEMQLKIRKELEEELEEMRSSNDSLKLENSQLAQKLPGPGKTTARDLSKSLSPKSEEKAKQLILEYANREGSGDKGLNISDFDSDQWSTSQASYLTDSEISFTRSKSTPGQSSSCSRRTSDDGSLSIFRTIDSINDDGSSPSIQPQHDAQNAANTELVKYAEALKNSRGKSSFRRRSASLSSF
ncbi:UNVERIFIED_CONTAM: protein CHUP1, chloroplastic [Sesamum angustifolium]|uniref:Protein CHUP1, chloroplastic n=1 Tax=Sesamum angustifolium TaxID=2727405 RepID=A0AAW2LJM0_9LAMI